MLRILGTCAALALFVIFVLPFAIDAYHRHEVATRLNAVMDEHDRAAFREWQGDPVAFARTLYERCALTHGQDAPDCQPYKAAIK
jgi:hypothetical protein